MKVAIIGTGLSGIIAAKNYSSNNKNQVYMINYENKYKNSLKFYSGSPKFFSTDIGSKIKEFSMPAVYKDEESNLNYFSAITLFPFYYIKNFFKRILLVNIFKELSFISILLLPSILFFFHSLSFLYFNHKYFKSLGKETPNGVIMIGFMELLISMQIIILFFIFDYLKSKSLSD